MTPPQCNSQARPRRTHPYNQNKDLNTMERDPTPAAVPKNLQFRVGMLVGLAVVLGIGFLFYALYARGVFQDTQRVTLVTDNADGVAIGMDLNFSGFPIGRVRRLALDEQGRARILVEIPRADAHWLRETSVFTLEKGLIGGATIRAHTGDLNDPPLATAPSGRCCGATPPRRSRSSSLRCGRSSTTWRR